MKHVKRIMILFMLAAITVGALAWLVCADSETASSLEQTFQKAKAKYVEKNMAAASAEIKKSAAFMKEQSAKASGQGKAALAESARELDLLAYEVKKGAVKSTRKMEDAFARAYLALAKEEHVKSSRSWTEKQAEKAGEGLEKAGVYLERSFSWAGQKAEAGTREIMQKSKDLSLKMKEKGRAVTEDIGKGLTETGNEIEKFGRKISPR